MSPEYIQAPVFDTHARGKLLLTGEYFVLDGAVALATPVRYGQSLHVETGEKNGRLFWTSKNGDGTAWFQAEFELTDLTPVNTTDKNTAKTLSSILLACRRQNPGFLAGTSGLEVTTQNDFPRAWGLGTSSTLIAALAKWACVDPYQVLFDTLGGSGYDIACAYADGPVLYKITDRTPEVQAVLFDPPFADSLFFVYLGKKQDSRAGIAHYREHARHNAALMEAVSRLTGQFLSATSLSDLDAVIREHEALISRALNLPRAKDLLFNDYWGEIKSLGAWGGDFVLATSARPEVDTQAYFKEKGKEVVLNWDRMVTTAIEL